MDNTDTAIAQRRYSTGAIVLHWLIALAIIANWLIAQIAEDAPKAKEEQLMGVHFALGMTVLILTVLRVLWRLVNRPPVPHPGHRRWERVLASVVHRLFYVLMVGLPLSGYMMLQTYMGGMGVNMFGLFEFPGWPMPKDKAANEVYHEIHEIFANLMLALLALHVAGALKHQLIDRDGTLSRMLPFGRGSA